MKIILASNSPRRKELLKDLGYDFTVVKIECEESYPLDLQPNEIAGYLSKLKADAYPNLQNDELLLTSDTIVVQGTTILGKPKSKEEAVRMLQNLSGSSHEVFTAITLQTKEKSITKTDVARVTFSEISNAEIEYYIEKYQPYDKAGSYGIQEWLGMAKISKIEGSFYTIMGLPTHLVYEIIKSFDLAE